MADNRVELPDGAWADLRNPREITRRERKPIQAANRRLNQYRDALRQLSGEKWDPTVGDNTPEARAAWVMTDEEETIYDDINELMAVAMVEAWSFDKPITRDGLGDIPGPASDELIIHIANGDYVRQMFVNTTDPDLENDDSPTSP